MKTYILKCAWCEKIIEDSRPLWKKILGIKGMISHGICGECLKGNQ